MNTPETPGLDVKQFDKSVVDEFMMSEYSTIASAHFELHDGLRQSFRFYLTIIALPLTAAAVIMKDSFGASSALPGSKWAMLQQLPPLLVLVLGLTAMVGIFMYLAMINIRFNIVLYTRTVNLVRAYFYMRANELGRENLDDFLHLPISASVPWYRERFRADWWSFVMVMLINSVYAFIALFNVLPICASFILTMAFSGLHVLAYETLGSMRDREPIVGLASSAAKRPAH